jgi:hypothetical protein
MSDDELIEKLLGIRQKIRTPKTTSAKKSSKPKEAKASKLDLRALLGSMSPEEKADFIASINK